VWAVVGLGNPGRRYAGSRHNVGFMFIATVAKAWAVRVKKPKFLAKTAEVTRNAERIILAMPQTHMNASGRAVRELIRGLGLEPERLVVVFDDIDLPLGSIRVRKEGGPGTHKGMASIVAEIGTRRFPRIRLGIASEEPAGDLVRYVLSPFRKTERERLGESLDMAREALDLILAGEIDTAMNRYN
jgi:PTH1 family peptidyl-tRNA hydrolase